MYTLIYTYIYKQPSDKTGSPEDLQDQEPGVWLPCKQLLTAYRFMAMS